MDVKSISFNNLSVILYPPILSYILTARGKNSVLIRMEIWKGPINWWPLFSITTLWLGKQITNKTVAKSDLAGAQHELETKSISNYRPIFSFFTPSRHRALSFASPSFIRTPALNAQYILVSSPAPSPFVHSRNPFRKYLNQIENFAIILNPFRTQHQSKIGRRKIRKARPGTDWCGQQGSKINIMLKGETVSFSRLG